MNAGAHAWPRTPRQLAPLGGMLQGDPKQEPARARSFTGGEGRDAGIGGTGEAQDEAGGLPHGSKARRRARGVRGETGRGSCEGGKRQRETVRAQAAKEEEAAA